MGKQRDRSALLAGLVAGALALSVALPALAKAAFKDPDRMIRSASVIALVNITRVEKADMKGSHWRYSQKASAISVSVLKGSLKPKATFYGGENFICARVNFEPGKAIVFLRRDQHLLVGNNWHYSVRRVRAGKVDWFSKKSWMKPEKVALDTVLKEIKKKVAMDANNKKAMPPFLREIEAAKLLCDGVAGETGRLPGGFKGFKQAIESRENNIESLDSLARKASPAGSLYAASLVLLADPARGKRLLKSMLEDDRRIIYASGCKRTEISVKEGAQMLIENGKIYSFDPAAIAQRLKASRATPSYLAAIRKARVVCDGVIGEAASLPHAFSAFKKALADRSLTAAALEENLEGSTPEGRMYFALLLMKHYPDRGKRYLISLKGDKTRIELQSGCEMFGSTLGEAADDLLGKGRLSFLDSVSLGLKPD